jgi:hypothetical protein
MIRFFTLFISLLFFSIFLKSNAQGVCMDSNALNYLQVGPCLYGPPVFGCTDPNALNYDPNATINDGSCQYAIYGCTDPNATNYNVNANVDDGSCTYDIYGCTDPSSINYNPSATIDDGTCQYGGPTGCTDPIALNYDPNAVYDDGSCQYAVYGCTDPSAINFNANATVDDGSCQYEIYGCTDPIALNYNSSATVDDGSCQYGGPSGCTDPTAINYDPGAVYDDGSCQYGIYGCMDPLAINYDPNATYDDGSCLYNDFYGCTDPNALNFDPNATFPDGSCIYAIDCNGDTLGTAYLDSCNQCVGGLTGALPCVFVGLYFQTFKPAKLEIFPNPNAGSFSIQNKTMESGIAQIFVFDLLGKQVYSAQQEIKNDFTFKLNLNLENGIYQVRVINLIKNNSNKLYAGRVLIQK